MEGIDRFSQPLDLKPALLDTEPQRAAEHHLLTPWQLFRGSLGVAWAAVP